MNVDLDGGAERDVDGNTSGESTVALDGRGREGRVITMNVSTSLEKIIFSRDAWELFRKKVDEDEEDEPRWKELPRRWLLLKDVVESVLARLLRRE